MGALKKKKIEQNCCNLQRQKLQFGKVDSFSIYSIKTILKKYILWLTQVSTSISCSSLENQATIYVRIDRGQDSDSYLFDQFIQSCSQLYK